MGRNDRPGLRSGRGVGRARRRPAAVWGAPAGAPPRYFAVRVPVMLGWTVQTKP